MAQSYNFTCDRCGFNISTEDITIPNEWGAITIDDKGHKHLCPACNMRFRVLFMRNHPAPKTNSDDKEESDSAFGTEEMGFGFVGLGEEVANGVNE